jgi:hypothetical protein
MPTLTPQKLIQPLNRDQQKEMADWARKYGSCVRQRSVRQETTMYKSGTLPINMYTTTELKDKERVVFSDDEINSLSEYDPDSSDSEIPSDSEDANITSGIMN